MGIYIEMNKTSETAETVSYEFNMMVVDKKYFKPGEMFPYKSDTHRAYGYCTFNKKTEEFIMYDKTTDPFFLKNTNYSYLVWMKLLQSNRSGNFPEINCFAS